MFGAYRGSIQGAILTTGGFGGIAYDKHRGATRGQCSNAFPPQPLREREREKSVPRILLGSC